jgi:hypothetical protein
VYIYIYVLCNCDEVSMEYKNYTGQQNLTFFLCLIDLTGCFLQCF